MAAQLIFEGKSLIDIAFSKVNNRSKFFTQGIGDREYLDSIPWRVENIPPTSSIEIEWNSIKNNENIKIMDGKFQSPVHELLPQESKQAHVRLVTPKNFNSETPIIIHFAGTGDTGFGRRTFLFASPMAKEGYASLILENAFYGIRKPKEQNGIYVPTISDFFKMSHGSVEEGRSLIKYFTDQGHNKIALTGMSMGGNVASMVGAGSELPVAIIPCVSPHNPEGPFLRYALKSSIEWTAIKKDLEGEAKEPIDYLQELFDLVDLRNLPYPKHTHLIHIVGGLKDAYIPTESVKILHDHWKGSELTWINTGHVSSVLFHTKTFRKIIKMTVDKF